jgi:hypothetical protein
VSQGLLDILWEDVRADKTFLVYALLDGARSPRIHPNVVLSLSDHACLYEGRLPLSLQEAAPYLVALRRDMPFTRWLLRECPNENWGVFLVSNARLMELRNHFRRLLKVKTEDGRVLNFRFYDPRVLRAYLPTCHEPELNAVFGPVRKFYAEAGGEHGGATWEFALENKSLSRKLVSSSVPNAVGTASKKGG